MRIHGHCARFGGAEPGGQVVSHAFRRGRLCRRADALRGPRALHQRSRDKRVLVSSTSAPASNAPSSSPRGRSPLVMSRACPTGGSQLARRRHAPVNRPRGYRSLRQAHAGASGEYRDGDRYARVVCVLFGYVHVRREPRRAAPLGVEVRPADAYVALKLPTQKSVAPRVLCVGWASARLCRGAVAIC